MKVYQKVMRLSLLCLLLLISFVPIVVYAADSFNETCTSQIVWDRQECFGYFTGDKNADSGAVTVFDQPALTDVSNANDLISKYQQFLNSSDERQIVGAAATINIMLGMNGTSWGNNKAAGIQYAKDNFNRWRDLILAYDSKRLIDWNYNYTPTGLRINSGYSTSRKDFFFRSSQTNDSLLVIRFRNPNGNVNDTFYIDKWCANIAEAGFISPLGNQIFGKVYVDSDGDGIKDSNEAGYQGATITLSGAANGTKTTDSSGNYSFPSLQSGNYTASIAVPNEYAPTTFTTKTIAINAQDVVVDFGIAPEYTISGNIYTDLNNNGSKGNGESNYAFTPQIVASRGTVSVKNDGTYRISNLIAGIVTVSFTNLPKNYYVTSPLNGPPPSYQVVVGPNCNTNGSLGASCQ